MIKQLSPNRVTLIIFLLGYSLIPVEAQTDIKWQRVYTGDEAFIEINVSSLRFEPGHILRVKFRTVFSKPEKLAGDSAGKYKSRFETIDFKSNENLYRLVETTLMDSKGRTLQSYTAPMAEEWRVLKHGGVMERLFIAAGTLAPFGSWKAVAYRLADGSPNARTPEPQLAKLIGTRVRLHTDKAEVGAKVCASLAYENKQATKEELSQKLGVRLESLGIAAEKVEMVGLRCEGGGWVPPQSLLVKVSEVEMLMLWEGVFLVLKKERADGRILPRLKRARA